MSSTLDIALSALGALGKKLGITANNIANINSEGFKKSRADLQEAPSSGVIVTISRVAIPGAPIPSADGSGEVRETSNVDIAEEIVDLHMTKHAFQANLKTIKTED